MRSKSKACGADVIHRIDWGWRTHFQGDSLMWLLQWGCLLMGACWVCFGLGGRLTPEQVIQEIKAKRVMPFMSKPLRSHPINSSIF